MMAPDRAPDDAAAIAGGCCFFCTAFTALSLPVLLLAMAWLLLGLPILFWLLLLLLVVVPSLLELRPSSPAPID